MFTMACNIYFPAVVSIVLFPLLEGGSIDPFMDQTMFMIDWKGPLLDSFEGARDNVVLMTKDQEQYKCILPQLYGSKQKDALDDYDGPSPAELMEGLFQQSSCSYRLESYWTYELCHGKHLRQYHEVKEQGRKPKLQEYFLGFGRASSADSASAGDVSAQSEESAEEESIAKPKVDENIKHRRIDGVDLPYYQVTMVDGTPCDLTQEPRKTRVLYVCQPDGHGEVYEMKETSTCEYEVMVLTTVLCSHPLFRPKNPPVNKISCHSLSGAPDKPHTLATWESESKQTQQGILFGVPEAEADVPQPSSPPERRVPKILTSTSSSPPSTPPPSNINKLTDKQVLRDLMSGDYCLQGGTGWWKHEVCIGRFARQFHKDIKSETNVILGHFNEADHLKWLTEHPNKRPKAVGKRKYLNYLYTGGDVCDITGKPRKVEVRLKCLSISSSPHGVSLFLSEPITCEYVLVVESALLCELMDQADENALLKKVNL